MSYQYIYQHGIYPNNINYPIYRQVYQQGYEQNYLNNQNQYSQNLQYNYNFYSQNSQNPIIYPYNNPNYTPNISGGYIQLGQIKSPDNSDVYLYQLTNGQKVAIMPTKDKATIVKTFIDGGSMNENDKVRGVMHTIEHCVFKGSDKLKDGDVFKYTGQMGASANASTDYALVDYYISAPYLDEKNLNKSIEIQGDMLSNPTFDKNALESEKGPICSEISMINDTPTTAAYDRLIRNLFQIKSNSENLVAGSIKTVQNLQRQDLVDHHNLTYNPENMYTVVVGDVDHKKAIQEIAKNFNRKAKYPWEKKATKEILTPIQSPKREDIRSSKTNFTSVFMGFAGPKAKDSKDFVINSMINYYLAECSGSEFKDKLEKISGSFSSNLQKTGLNKNDPYAIVCALNLNPNDEQEGIDIFYDAIQKLQKTPLNDDEMTAIKNYMKKQAQYIYFDSESLCDMLGHSLIDDSLDLFTNYEQIIDSITKEDIQNFSKKYLDLNKISMVVVHPTSVSEDNIITNYDNSKYSLKNVQNSNKNKNNISFGSNKKIQTDEIKEYILSNNTHLALNDTNSSLCVFDWNISTSPIKPKNPNIPLVLSYMFKRGSEYKNQSEVEKYKELNGITAEVSVNDKSIKITADCLEDNVEKTLSLMNELLYHPKLTRSDFNDAKKYIKDALLASQKDANSNLLDNLYPGYFPTEAQMLKTIDSLKFEDVTSFYNDLLKSASSYFAATIPMKKNPNIAQKVIEYQNVPNITFKESTPKLTPIFEENPEPNVIYDTDDLNQAQIYKSYKFPLSGNIEDEVKFELVNTILGAAPSARLFSDLRDKQNLAYSVSSTIESFENTGILTLKIQTTTDNKKAGVQSFDNVEKSLEGFKKHTESLCKEYVSDDELASAKMILKQNIIGAFQNPLDENGLIMMNMLEPYGIKRIDKYIEAIDKVTKEDIKKASNFIFSKNPTISILASKDTIESQMDYLKQQGTVSKAAA